MLALRCEGLTSIENLLIIHMLTRSHSLMHNPGFEHYVNYLLPCWNSLLVSFLM